MWLSLISIYYSTLFTNLAEPSQPSGQHDTHTQYNIFENTLSSMHKTLLTTAVYIKSSLIPCVGSVKKYLMDFFFFFFLENGLLVFVPCCVQELPAGHSSCLGKDLIKATVDTH